MQNLNFILEVINGSVSILTYFLLVFLAYYIAEDFGKETFTWRNLFVLSTAMALVIALFVEKTGTFLTRSVIWLWRMTGGSVPFSVAENLILIVGAALTMMGLLMLIRILSRQRFGNWPWAFAAVIVFSYDAAAVITHLMR